MYVRAAISIALLALLVTMEIFVVVIAVVVACNWFSQSKECVHFVFVVIYLFSIALREAFLRMRIPSAV